MGGCESSKKPKKGTDGIKIKEAATKEYPIFKVLMLGDVNVGKTSLLSVYCDNLFDNPTFDFKEKQVEVKGQVVRIQLWDTAGQERFRVITSSYYREAHACIVAFDLTRTPTFESVPKWLTEIGRYSEAETVIMLVGNKSDLEGQVTDKMVDNYMEDNSLMMTYMKTSAKSSNGVNELFVTLIGEMMEKHNSEAWKNT